MKYFPFRTVPHCGNFPHFRGNVSRFSILSAIALALIPLFYGCSDPSSRDLPKNSGVEETGSQGRITDFDRENAGIPPLPDAVDSSPSEESPTPSEPTDPAESSAPSTPTTPSDSVDSDADLSGLSMEDFDFSTAVIGETGPESEVDSTETQKAVRSLDVPEEIREEFTRRSDLSYTPKLSGWKEGGETVDPNGERFLFRYRFESGSESRWNVSHRVWKRVIMAGHESEIETVSQIVRRWKIGEMESKELALAPKGGEESPNREADVPSSPTDNPPSTDPSSSGTETVSAWPIEYFIDEMNLEQHESGKDPVIYHSGTDQEVPPEFSYFGTEKAVGTGLERFRVDSFGMITDKEKLIKEFSGSPKDSRVLFPFPSEPVAVGETWTLPWTIFLMNKDKTIKTVRAVKKFTLENVTEGLATISVTTVPTSIIGDPYLEGQLAERLYSGTCRFDIPKGRILKSEIEFSRSVPEAYGHATFLDYRCRITEEFIRE